MKIPEEGVAEEAEFIEEPKKFLWVLLKYGITILVAVGFVFAVLGIRNFFSSELSNSDKYKYLADAFTIPGMVFISLALLILVSRKGAFTGLGYAVRHLVRMLVPFIVKKDVTYEEYLKSKEDRKANSMVLCFFIVGAIMMVMAIVFVAIFYQCSDAKSVKDAIIN